MYMYIRCMQAKMLIGRREGRGFQQRKTVISTKEDAWYNVSIQNN